MKGTCYSRRETFVSVFAPTEAQVRFLRESLVEVAEGALSIGGDINLALNPQINSSKDCSAFPLARLQNLEDVHDNHIVRYLEAIEPWREGLYIFFQIP